MGQTRQCGMSLWLQAQAMMVEPHSHTPGAFREHDVSWTVCPSAPATVTTGMTVSAQLTLLKSTEVLEPLTAEGRQLKPVAPGTSLLLAVASPCQRRGVHQSLLLLGEPGRSTPCMCHPTGLTSVPQSPPHRAVFENEHLLGQSSGTHGPNI